MMIYSTKFPVRSFSTALTLAVAAVVAACDGAPQAPSGGDNVQIDLAPFFSGFSSSKTPCSEADIVRLGVAHVPQGRGTLPELSVEDNLLVGAYTRKDKEIQHDMEKWYDVYPVLAERRSQRAGSLSGGEQQMLAVARALMSRPDLLLLDEPSLGLAPMIVQDLFERFHHINKDTGTTMLVVEQNAALALGIADRGYVLESGRISHEGPADELINDDAIRKAYLGV